MTLIAGVDIGNATTEIVIADEAGVPLLADRVPTRGVKGSPASGSGAARLLARMERGLGRGVDLVVLTPQRPVSTLSAQAPPPVLDTGRLRLLSTGSSTPSGSGAGAGRPVDLRTDPIVGEPVVLVARDRLGYRDTVDRVRRWQSAGASVAGLLLAGDEAVLVSARLADGDSMPVVDCVDPDSALACLRVLVEVGSPGQSVRHLTDPIRVAASLGLATDEHDDAVAASSSLQGARAGVIGVGAEHMPVDAGGDGGWVRLGEERAVDLRRARPRIVAGGVGPATTLHLPGAEPVAASDLWMVDLDELARLPGLHPHTIARRSVIVSALADGGQDDEHVDGFREACERPVVVRDSEAAAGRRGALTTPGASSDAVVIDLGGGTVDATDASMTVSAAGSGAMMTTAVADALGISTGAAEWVKRAAASRIDAPHLAVRETGDREFLDPAAPSGTVGWLVAPGPGGLLPFSRDVELTEWRIVRQALKRAVFTDNLTRVLRTLGAVGGDVLLVGGPAGDDELLDAINGVLPGVVAGRGNVAGSLGHRWSVAYGLVLGALDQQPR